MARTVSRSPTVTLRVVRPHLRVEKELMRTGTARLAAMDEVGRGALAGPVTVGVVVVTERIGRVPAGLRDSKLLTPAARAALVKPVRRWVGEWGIGHASPGEIDTIGIIAALRTAGRRALAQLSAPVDAVLLDGNHNYLSMPVDDQPTLFDPIEGAAQPIDSVGRAAEPIEVPCCRGSHPCTSGSRRTSRAPRWPGRACWRRRSGTGCSPSWPRRTRNTGSTRTRATARPSTWRRCGLTARAWCTGRAGGCRVARTVGR